MRLLKYGAVLLFLMTLWGCGKGSSSAPITVNPVTQKAHSDPNWYVANTGGNHPAAYLANGTSCMTCHGNDLRGGIVKVSCFNPTLPQCHNGPNGAPHPVGVAFLAAAAHGIQAKTNGLDTCKSCHSNNAVPLAFSTPKNNMPTGCQGCHFNPADPSSTTTHLAHPYGWLVGRGTTQGVANATSHATAQNLTASCGLCHGATLAGGAAPSCFGASPFPGTSCHVSNPAAAPTGCTSCHGFAPASGMHASHTAIPGVTASAATCVALCHVTRGPGTASHATTAAHAKTNFNTTYQSQTVVGPVGFNGTTCANISCHGGKTTPLWASGAITDCFTCHKNAGDPLSQYNDYYSGFVTSSGLPNLHEAHLQFYGAGCTDCHDANMLNPGTLFNNHFGYLASHNITGSAAQDTPVRRASQTITLSGSGGGSYTANGVAPVKGSCINIACHSGLESRPW